MCDPGQVSDHPFPHSENAGRDGCLIAHSGIVPIGYVCENLAVRCPVFRKGAMRFLVLLGY